MRLVTKGQEESNFEMQKTDRALIVAAENEYEIASKSFLQEAHSTINTQLERPPVNPISPNEDDLQFLCIDIDTYADKPPSKYSLIANFPLLQSICNLALANHSMKHVL